MPDSIALPARRSMVQVRRTEAGVIALRSNCAPFYLLAVIGASLAHTATRDNFWHRISPLQEVPRARVHEAQAAQKRQKPKSTWENSAAL